GPGAGPAVRPGARRDRAAAGVPVDRAAADERLHRVAEEHHDRGRVLGARSRRDLAVPVRARREPVRHPDLDHHRVPGADRAAGGDPAGPGTPVGGGPVTTLYDLPGPRATARNRVAGLVALGAVAVLVGFVAY